MPHWNKEDLPLPSTDMERKNNVYSIYTISQRMLFEILCKFSHITLCRMRQTCLGIDNFVKQNEKEVSSCSRHEVDMEVTIGQTAMKVFINEREFELSNGWRTRLSGLAISLINLGTVQPDPDHFVSLIEYFNITCNRVAIFLKLAPANDVLLRLLNAVVGRQNTLIFESNVNDHNFTSICNSAKCSSKIMYAQHKPYTLDFHNVNKFKGFVICGKNDAINFTVLLLDIHTDNFVGTIETVEIEVELSDDQKNREFPWIDRSHLAEENLSLPIFKTLWSSCSSENYNIPNMINIMEAGGKYLVICVYDINEIKDIVIYFVKTFSDVLDQLIKSLRIQNFPQDLRDDFLEAPVERQAEILSMVFEDYQE